MLWAMIHGLTSLLITKPHYQWVERNLLIDALIDNALQGLRAPKPVLAN